MSLKTTQTEKERLFQAAAITQLGATASMTDMITVAQSIRNKNYSRGILSAVVPCVMERQSRDFDWLFTDHDGKPGVMIFHLNGEKVNRYYR